MMPAYYEEESIVGWDDSIKPTSPELMATLITAARAPENAGCPFASMRRTLYEYIADFEAIEAGRALIAFLDQEKNDPEMPMALYGHIATRRGKNPGRVMVRAYRDERDLRHRIGEMLWKHEAAVEMLVRDELLPAWRSDPEYAKGIVKLLKRELIRVPASWVAGADAALVSALGDLVQDSV